MFKEVIRLARMKDGEGNGRTVVLAFECVCKESVGLARMKEG